MPKIVSHRRPYILGGFGSHNLLLYIARQRRRLPKLVHLGTNCLRVLLHSDLFHRYPRGRSGGTDGELPGRTQLRRRVHGGVPRSIKIRHVPL